ncbi:MAG: type II toxin-antitoxin system VapB family antitoxin [Streptosporangiaceae bacterium]|nr:type II toxin-antitoxin system VapB family antitoxin [Streptosporangiaceae bacterium]
MVYGWCVLYKRTNIEINEELVGRVMERYHLTTKKEAVDLALRYTAGTPLTQEFLDSVHGMGWGGDLAEMRNDPPPPGW